MGTILNFDIKEKILRGESNSKTVVFLSKEI
jgi:hypothetical protein